MAAEAEMRRIILHAATKLRNSTYPQMASEAKMAMAYAEAILELLASYLKVEEPSSNGHARPADPPPRDEHGRFIKSAEDGTS